MDAEEFGKKQMKKYKKKNEERNGKVKYSVPVEDYDMPRYSN